MLGMSKCGNLTTVTSLISRPDLYFAKRFQTKMSQRIAVLVLIFSGLSMAYLSTFLPAMLMTALGGKRQYAVSLSSHDTSVIRRGKQHQFPIDPDIKKEATVAMNIALEMEAQGKYEKASKLFQHALKLDPLHADILTYFGEFLEHHEKDVMKAEKLYSKALLVCPDHSKALTNKRRILSLVEDIDQKMYNVIDKKLDLLYKVPQNHPGLRRQKRESYFQHIYHSNAIEGNTLTLSQTRSIVETRIAVGGKSLVEQNEVLGMDAALSYVNNTLLGRIGSINMEDLLQIHKRVLGFVDLEQAGQFRTTQVFVGDFTPPPAPDVPHLMEEFLEWLNSEDALGLHPIEFAALAHYKLVVIHPFYDGNGRTSRLLMNLILMQVGFPPVTIHVDERLRYYEALEEGNNGDIRTFIRFIAECAERTLDEFLLATLENAAAIIPNLSRRKNYTRSERIIHVDAEP